jgi:hypothetical protein
VFELGEATFDKIAQGINVAVDDPLDFPVPFWGNDGLDAFSVKIGQDGVGVVALVPSRIFGWGPGSAMTGA